MVNYRNEITNYNVGQAEGDNYKTAVKHCFACFTTSQGRLCLLTGAMTLCPTDISLYYRESPLAHPSAKGKYIPFGIPIFAAAPLGLSFHISLCDKPK